MRITLKLFATLSEWLPAHARDNAAEVEVAEGVTAGQVIDQFSVPRDMVHLVLVNGIYLAPDQRDTQPLNPDDALAIWPPVAGG